MLDSDWRWASVWRRSGGGEPALWCSRSKWKWTH